MRLSHSVSGPILILSFHLHPGLPHVSSPYLSPPHLPHSLDLITRTISGEQYKSRSSSLCNYLQSLSHFLLRRPKYLSQHPILDCPESRSFFLLCERPSFTPVQNSSNCNSTQFACLLPHAGRTPAQQQTDVSSSDYSSPSFGHLASGHKTR